MMYASTGTHGGATVRPYLAGRYGRTPYRSRLRTMMPKFRRPIRHAGAHIQILKYMFIWGLLDSQTHNTLSYKISQRARTCARQLSQAARPALCVVERASSRGHRRGSHSSPRPTYLRLAVLGTVCTFCIIIVYSILKYIYIYICTRTRGAPSLQNHIHPSMIARATRAHLIFACKSLKSDSSSDELPKKNKLAHFST